MGRSEAGSIGHLFPVPRFEIKKEIKVKVKIKDRKMKRDEFPDLYEDEPWPSGFSFLPLFDWDGESLSLLILLIGFKSSNSENGVYFPE